MPESLELFISTDASHTRALNLAQNNGRNKQLAHLEKDSVRFITRSFNFQTQHLYLNSLPQSPARVGRWTHSWQHLLNTKWSRSARGSRQEPGRPRAGCAVGHQARPQRAAPGEHLFLLTAAHRYRVTFLLAIKQSLIYECMYRFLHRSPNRWSECRRPAQCTLTLVFD